MALRIKDWDSTFENWKTRSLDSPLRWVNLPTNQDSPVYRMLMSTAAGIHAFGVFIALVEVAGKMPERGVLADDKGDLSIKGISVRTGIRDGDLRKALAILTSPEVGWVVAEQPAAQPDGNLRASSAHPKIIHIQSSPLLQSSSPPGDARGAEPDPHPDPEFAEFWAAWPKHDRKRDRDRCVKLWRSGGLGTLWAGQIRPGLEAWKRSKEWAKNSGEFIPGPEVWLRNRRWTEGPADAAPAAKPGAAIAPEPQQRAFRAWWNALGVDAQDRQAAAWGVPRSVVDQASNHQHVRAEWAAEAGIGARARAAQAGATA